MKSQEKELKILNNILDAKYQKADLDEEVEKWITYQMVRIKNF